VLSDWALSFSPSMAGAPVRALALSASSMCLPDCVSLSVSHSLCLTLLITEFASVPHLSLSRSLALSLAHSYSRALAPSGRSLTRALSLARALSHSLAHFAHTHHSCAKH
jgi:hypothetical protein